jgi:hypothetical protein
VLKVARLTHDSYGAVPPELWQAIDVELSAFIERCPPEYVVYVPTFQHNREG